MRRFSFGVGLVIWLVCTLLGAGEASAALKDQFRLRFPGSNEDCRSFYVISEAGAPAMVSVRIINNRTQREWRTKVRVDPGDELCAYDPRYEREQEYCSVWIVSAWYVE